MSYMEQQAQDQIEGGIRLKEEFDAWWFEVQRIAKEFEVIDYLGPQDSYFDDFRVESLDPQDVVDVLCEDLVDAGSY